MSRSNGDTLLEVHKLVNGDRPSEHGKFEDNVSKLCGYMRLLTDKEYTREEGRAFFIALKLCRVVDGQLGNDTLRDLVGYLGLIKDDIDKNGQTSISNGRKELDQEQPLPGRYARNQNGTYHIGGDGHSVRVTDYAPGHYSRSNGAD